jgi:hypothetical protein
MAISLPATSLLLDIEGSFRHGYPVFSGDGANDQPYGWRGINNQCNYSYAWRTQVLSCGSMWDDSAILQTNAAAYGSAAGQVVGQVSVYLGADVALIKVTADVTDGGVQIRTSVGNGAGSALLGGGAGVSGRSVRTDTVVPGSSGLAVDILVSVAKDADAANVELREFIVEEFALVAGDIP